MATVLYDLEVLKPEFQANTSYLNTQILPELYGLSNGGFVVAYNHLDGQGFILVDFYDANGVAVGEARIPFDGGSDANGAPAITQLTNGNVLIVWEDDVAGDTGLKGAIYTENGEVVSEEFDLASNDTNTMPSVTALEDGGFVLISQWATDSIFLQIYDENGDFVTGDLDIDPGTGASEPVVTSLADGAFVVSWTVPNGANHDIVARIFEADGTPRPVNGSTDPFVVATSGNNTQPAITALPNGNWAIAYTDSGWGNEDIGITLTIMGPNGEVVNAFEQVNAPGDPQDESDPDITVLDNGFIVVSWTYPASPGADDDIHCRIFDQAGNPIAIGGGSSLIVIDNSFANEVKSAVSGLFAGQFVAAWQDAESDLSGGQISATVRELVRTTTGDGASETLDGDDIRDVMNGNGGADTLNGFGGNDTLDGGANADTMEGGAGDDTYVVDDAGDEVIEAADGGTDTVQSSISFTLGSTLENLTLTGGANINGTGTAAANVMIGNSGTNTLTGFGGADRLDGGAGADAMIGGHGDDTYVVDNAGDTVNESSGSGIDTVASSLTFTLANGFENLILNGASAINGTGNDGVNALTGNSAANVLSGLGQNDTLVGYGGGDTLNGGAGADAMTGGNGNDTYVVDNAGDTTVEAAGGGTDLVQSSITFTLAANVENLVLTGASAINGTGNAGANAITGNSAGNQLFGLAENDTLSGFGGNDTLNGGAGADAMSGGNGDDTYIVENAGDTASEASGSGTDLVQSTVTFTLAAGIDNLALNGAAAINGTGNGSANTLSGNSAVNRLDGNGGTDTLTGFGAADVFVFDDGDGADTIADFANGTDTFDLTAVAGVDEFSDLTVIDNGATVTVDYGTGSFTLANVGNPAQLDAGDFVFA